MHIHSDVQRIAIGGAEQGIAGRLQYLSTKAEEDGVFRLSQDVLGGVSFGSDCRHLCRVCGGVKLLL